MHEDKKEKRFRDQANSKTFQNIIKIFGLDKKSVFDIGCSNGEFLIHFGKDSVGINITQAELEYGRSKGLDMRYGNIESKDFNIEETFDVIFANNVFEHMYAPHDFLNNIKKYLKEGGVLVLGVPCIPSIKYLLRFSKFRGSLAITHINFFTRQTLIKTVERGGWKVLDARGFRFSNKFIDKLLNPIYPHFYVVARPGLDILRMYKD